MPDVNVAHDYKVRDISLAAWGRKEILMAEDEMPGLMALREEYGQSKPLAGARIVGSLHMTIQTAVLIETLVKRSAHRRHAGPRATSTRLKITPQRPSPRRATPVFAWKGMRPKTEYWDCMPGQADASAFEGGKGPQHDLGRRRRSDRAGSTTSTPSCSTARTPFKRPVSEETTTGVHRLYEMFKKGTLKVPGHQRQRQRSPRASSTTCTVASESLTDAIRRGTDVMMAGKVAVVAGYGDVGKGSAASLKNGGCRVLVTEIDPICALQAAMEGFEVVTMDDAAPRGDIFVTATGNIDVLTSWTTCAP